MAAEHTSALMLGTQAANTLVLNNLKAQTDPTHPDYTTGDVVTFYYSDPMISTDQGLKVIARRLYDMMCHSLDWTAGESPLVMVQKGVVQADGSADPLLIRPRPLLFGDVATVKDANQIATSDGHGLVVTDGLFVIAESPTILVDGRLGGSSMSAAYNSMYSVPRDDGYGLAYGDPSA